MRCSLLLVVSAVLATTLGGWASAATKPDASKPRPPGNVTNRPAASPQSGIRADKGKSGHAAARHDDRRDDRGPRRHFPGPSYFYGYDDSYFYGNYYPFYDGVVFPPLYVPADPWFGPSAMQRFWGGFYGNGFYGNGTGWQPGYDDGFARERDIGEAPPAARKDVEVPPVNVRSNAQAWKYIGYGDALFAQQKYAEANDRYRKASRSAPQLAEAWYRQAFALSAVGRYDLAVAAVKRGLKLDPKWPKSDFDLDDLFGAEEPAKSVYLDAMVDATVEKPNDADLLFMAGVHLYFDGQIDKAKKLFERTRRIAGVDAGHIEAFLANE